jgi:hypothetical protein
MALTEATCEEVRDRRGRDPRAMPAQYVSSDAIGVKDQDRRTLPDVNAPKGLWSCRLHAQRARTGSAGLSLRPRRPYGCGKTRLRRGA